LAGDPPVDVVVVVGAAVDVVDDAGAVVVVPAAGAVVVVESDTGDVVCGGSGVEMACNIVVMVVALGLGSCCPPGRRRWLINWPSASLTPAASVVVIGLLTPASASWATP